MTAASGRIFTPASLQATRLLALTGARWVGIAAEARGCSDDAFRSVFRLSPLPDATSSGMGRQFQAASSTDCSICKSRRKRRQEERSRGREKKMHSGRRPGGRLTTRGPLAAPQNYSSSSGSSSSGEQQQRQRQQQQRRPSGRLEQRQQQQQQRKQQQQRAASSSSNGKQQFGASSQIRPNVSKDHSPATF